MTKQEIIDYTLSTPDNTNPRILKEMLESLGGTTTTQDVFWITGNLLTSQPQVIDKSYNEIIEAIDNNLLPVISIPETTTDDAIAYNLYYCGKIYPTAQGYEGKFGQYDELTLTASSPTSPMTYSRDY